MSEKTVTVRFAREGERNGVPLHPDTVYRVSVDGGPRSEFRSPWTEGELADHIKILRNFGGEEKPGESLVRRIGMELAVEVFKIKGLAERLGGSPTVYWVLDYPELAEIPWELLTQDEEPHAHLLLRDKTSFVRKVTAAVEDAETLWPTGHDETIRMLYVWGERGGATVPHEQHLEALTAVCSRVGITPLAAEVCNIGDLEELCRETKFHLVHILAHGDRVHDPHDDQDGQWGLLFKEGVVTGQQIARALRAGDSTPALVTVAACDSANNENNTFGSVAYHLHTHGIPLVLASQFRLNKKTSVVTAAAVYNSLLDGGEPIAVVQETRRQVSPSGNEGWANEVLYSRYRHQSLLDMSGLARQQAGLRRARVISKVGGDNPDQAIEDLKVEIDKLRVLANKVEEMSNPDRQALAESYGLIGSMLRRIAELKGGGKKNDMRMAAMSYEKGFQADRNSFWCGINMVLLYKLIGDHDTANKFTPMVRYAVESEIERGTSDHWVFATAGELEVYDGDANEAIKLYLKFIDKVQSNFPADRDRVLDTLSSAHSQLEEIEDKFDGAELESVRSAAAEAREILAESME